MQRRTESKRNGGGADQEREYGGDGGERVGPYGGAHCECFGQVGGGKVGWGPGKVSHLVVQCREGGIDVNVSSKEDKIVRL